jgi:hypothetical protein
MNGNDGSPAPENADPAIHDLYRLWRDRAGDGRLPSASDMDVDSIAEKYAGMALIAVERRKNGPTRYRYVRVGPAHRATLGRNIEGYSIDELVAPQQVDYYVGVYNRIVEEAAPHYWMRMNSLVGSDLHTFERLLVPISDDGENVDGLLGVWVWLDGRPVSH